MEKYDAAIIGAGPAGLEAARVLSEKRKSVVILEKNSIIGKKVCAGGLTTKDFELGLSLELADVLFNEVTLETPWAKCRVKSKTPYVATLTREKLGNYLAKEDRLQGVKIYTEKEVVEVKKNSLLTKDGLEIQFNYLIGADGGQSLVRKYLGLESNKLLIAFHYKLPVKFERMEYIFNAKLFGSGYGWIFPHKEFTSVGTCVDARFGINASDLQENFKKWTDERNISLNEDYREAWVINYDYQGFQFDNIFLAGDAGGFASGLTGEGIYFAMVSGIEIAKKILDDKYNTPDLKKILQIKGKHDRLLRMLQASKPLSQIAYCLGGLIFKTHILDKKLVKSFS